MTRKEASRLAAKKAAAVTNRIKALKKLGLTHEAAKAREKEERELLELLVDETDKL